MITRMMLEELGFVKEQEEGLVQLWTHKKHEITVAYYPKDFPEEKKTYPDMILLSLEELIDLIVKIAEAKIALKPLSDIIWGKSGESIGELEDTIEIDDEEEEVLEYFQLPLPPELRASILFPVFYNALRAGVVSFGDTFKTILMGDKYEFQANQKTYADIEHWELPSKNGYEKGGKYLQKKESPVSGNIEFEQISWRASNHREGLGPITAVLIYDSSHPDMILVGYIRVGKGIEGLKVDPECDINIVGISFNVGE